MDRSAELLQLSPSESPRHSAEAAENAYSLLVQLEVASKPAVRGTGGIRYSAAGLSIDKDQQEFRESGALSPMSASLATTFAVLRDSGARYAQEVLVTALDVPYPEIQEQAAGALLKRASVTGHLEVLKRCERLPTGVLTQIKAAGRRLDAAFRQGLQQGGPDLVEQLLHCLRLADADEHVAPVLTIVRQPHHPAYASAVTTLRSLIDRLYDQWQSERELGDSAALAQVEGRRVSMLQELGKLLASVDDIAQPEVVIEGVLILGRADEALVRRVLWNSAAPIRDVVSQLLMGSRHPGVLALICDSLNYAYPHPKAFEAIQRRDDPEFIAQLLRSISGRLNRHQQENLRQIQSLDWLRNPDDTLPTVPPQLQPAVLKLLAATHTSPSLRSAVEQWMLRSGSPEARQEVAASGSTVDDEMVSQVVQESLNDTDAAIQAWAVGQLRKHAVPEAFGILVSRLDSPHAAVRDAARAELSSFNIERVLPLCQSLDGETGARVGQLLLKVDESVQRRLTADLSHPVRQRRLKALAAIRTLNLVDLMLPALRQAADDPDYVIRHAVADTLSRSATDGGWLLLSKLARDSHPRVREVAANGLLQVVAEHPELSPVGQAASYGAGFEL